ncbi:hypothetical protein ACFQ3Z_40945 [Streptomyces nogalater]
MGLLVLAAGIAALCPRLDVPARSRCGAWRRPRPDGDPGACRPRPGRDRGPRDLVRR